MFVLWAVHISDNVLLPEWWAGGLVVAAALAALGAWRIRDEEIPRVALLTAAFFVASAFHVRVGPSTVHLLFNGLVGVMLGLRAGLAIPIGLLLQYLLLQHGGYLTLGVNSCVMVLPALLAWGVFGLMHRLPWMRRPSFRSLMVTVCCLAWVLSLVFSIALLTGHLFGRVELADSAERAAWLTFHPLTLAASVLLAVLAAWAERRLENAPEFALGLLIGELAVLGTVALNGLVLLAGGEQDWTLTVLLLVVVHLPIAVVEGVVVGFAVGFLAKVKPDLLGLPAQTPAPLVILETETHATAISPGPPPCPDSAGDSGPGADRVRSSAGG
ncbi:MAG: energy-coupling factor ABC transporter permease [Gemmataceae bacterium]|nr:energy-coupling factor ABC transporter permease [Gemmataceae bacterium]